MYLNMENNMSRKRLYDIIEKSEGHDIPSSIYDYLMIVAIVVSLTPLALHRNILKTLAVILSRR